MRRAGTAETQEATRGFVLLNALVLVAALAAAAAFVLSRAESTRQRQAGAQGAVQGGLYLDGFEALALTLLRADQRGGPIDGPGDNWARAEYTVDIDRGRISGGIQDLQGRFNVNWLANPEDVAALAAFERLVVDLNLRPQLVGVIVASLRPGGAAAQQAYARLQPPVTPVGGPVLMVEQLRQIPGLRPRDYARLAPHLAALPSDSQLNVNTASVTVLKSLLPGAKAEGLTQILSNRARQPFGSTEDFLTRVAPVVGDAGVPELEELRFGIGSAWFHADIAVELDGLILRRQTIFERRPLPYGPQVAYRLENRP